jgi:hypothetical protein
MIDVSDGEEKTFHVFSGSQNNSDKSKIGIVFNSLGHTLTIKKPFIEARLAINGVYQSEYAVDSNTTISGQINWVNNLDTKVEDLEIRAQFSGNALNRKSINANQGYYNSSLDTILWDKNSQYKFSEVNPGDSGSVNFTLSPLSLFSASRGILTAPTIQVSVSVSARQSTLGGTQKLNDSELKIIRVISNVGLGAKALYYIGAFPNSGPIPPKAEQETTYTIVWNLSNTANNISDAKVRSTLPAWVRFIGPISPPTENLTYDPATREVIWEVGGIPASTGITGDSREVSFKVGLMPSLSQVGTSPVLINETTLTGRDDFAKVNVQVSKLALSTLLINDPSFNVTGANVVE